MYVILTQSHPSSRGHCTQDVKIVNYATNEIITPATHPARCFPFIVQSTTNERTNEVYLPMNGVNNDWLPVEVEAHQSWPPKK